MFPVRLCSNLSLSSSTEHTNRLIQLTEELFPRWQSLFECANRISVLKNTGEGNSCSEGLASRMKFLIVANNGNSADDDQHPQIK